MDDPMPFFATPYESVVERRIREAMDRGEFDDLPGAGEPLADTGTPYDELWWVKRWLERNELRDGPSPAGEDTTPRVQSAEQQQGDVG